MVHVRGETLEEQLVQFYVVDDVKLVHSEDAPVDKVGVVLFQTGLSFFVQLDSGFQSSNLKKERYNLGW